MNTIIVGLGNPGEKYKNTRHNIGFMVLNEFAEKNNFPEFSLSKKYSAEISKGNFGGQNILLVKPQTFMNESGKAVKKIVKNSPAENLIVVHDDVDLPVGKIKIIKERGSAGHKGVESIIKAIGNDGLIRFRIGIGRQIGAKAMKVVLKNFSADEQKIIDEIINKTAKALDFAINNGLEKAMNEYN